MRWGDEHSAGHYLDLWSAVLGLALFPTGLLLHLIQTVAADCNLRNFQHLLLTHDQIV